MKRLKSPAPFGHPERTRPDEKFWDITGRYERLGHARSEFASLGTNMRTLRRFTGKAEDVHDAPPTIDDLNTALEYGRRARKTKNRLLYGSGIVLGSAALVGCGIGWVTQLTRAHDQQQADHKQVVEAALRDPLVLEDLGICETELRAQEQLTQESQRTHRLSKAMPGPSDYQAAVHLASEKNFPCDGRIDEITYFVDRRKVVIGPSDITEFNLSDICDTAGETRTALGWIAAEVAREANMDC